MRLPQLPPPPKPALVPPMSAQIPSMPAQVPPVPAQMPLTPAQRSPRLPSMQAQTLPAKPAGHPVAGPSCQACP